MVKAGVEDRAVLLGEDRSLRIMAAEFVLLASAPVDQDLDGAGVEVDAASGVASLA